MSENGHARIVTLADERRSQPQQLAELRDQILALQAQYSTLAQRFAADSANLHTAWQSLGRAHLEAVAELQRRREHDARMASSFMARLRWLTRG